MTEEYYKIYGEKTKTIVGALNLPKKYVEQICSDLNKSELLAFIDKLDYSKIEKAEYEKIRKTLDEKVMVGGRSFM